MNKTKTFLLLFLAVLIGLVGCNNSAEPNPPDEEFKGVYLVRDMSLVEDLKKQDSVTLNIIDNAYYSMIFSSASGDPNEVNFCDLEGTLIDFGTPKVSFDPTFIHYSNCDTLRIPKGLFEADFRNHGDTVYIWREINSVDPNYDSLYQLMLLKTK